MREDAKPGWNAYERTHELRLRVGDDNEWVAFVDTHGGAVIRAAVWRGATPLRGGGWEDIVGCENMTLDEAKAACELHVALES